MTMRPGHLHRVEYGTIVEEWWCPVCSRAAHRVYKCGRPRIYCSNACRQRAYRWRRDHQARLAATPEHPAERASIGLRGHALRSKRDFVSQCVDARRREVTVCGLLARPARHGRWRHNDFVGDSSTWSCRSCIRLVAIPNDTIDSSWPPPPRLWHRYRTSQRQPDR